VRLFLIAADVVMGSILGLFLYAVVSRLWSGVQGPATAAVILAASIAVVLFRRPGGTLGARARRGQER
jgi:hypothetical protein